MRVISNAKAREGKGTMLRTILAAYLWERRQFGPFLDRFKGSTSSWGTCALMIWKGRGFYFTEIVCNLIERRDDHIGFTAIKKGCKRKTEYVKVLLY